MCRRGAMCLCRREYVHAQRWLLLAQRATTAEAKDRCVTLAADPVQIQSGVGELKLANDCKFTHVAGEVIQVDGVVGVVVGVGVAGAVGVGGEESDN